MSDLHIKLVVLALNIVHSPFAKHTEGLDGHRVLSNSLQPLICPKSDYWAEHGLVDKRQRGSRLEFSVLMQRPSLVRMHGKSIIVLTQGPGAELLVWTRVQGGAHCCQFGRITVSDRG